MHQPNNSLDPQFDAIDYLQRRIQEETRCAASAGSPEDAALHLELARAFCDQLILVLVAAQPVGVIKG